MPPRPRVQPPPIPPQARRGAVAEPVRALPPPVPPEARRVRSPATVAASSPEALVASAQGGDARSFAELVRRYRPRILALALHMTASPTDAEDIAQEVFLRAFQHLAEFEGRSAFFTWIYRIALNKILETRARRRRLVVDLDDPRVALAVAVDASGQPQRALELRETYTQLVRAFDALSPLLRSTVALTTLQGLSFAEAAVVLSTTEGTIAWRMHEAREQLRRALRPESVAADAPVPTPSRRRAVATDTSSASLALALALACI